MTTTIYDHWCNVPASAWRWTNFSPANFACRSNGQMRVHDPALDNLQALRDYAHMCRNWEHSVALRLEVASCVHPA